MLSLENKQLEKLDKSNSQINAKIEPRLKELDENMKKEWKGVDI